jgi:hypothetical protein
MTEEELAAPAATPDEHKLHEIVARGREHGEQSRTWRDPWDHPTVDRVLRAAMIVVVLALGVLGIGMPQSVLRGGVAWLGFLFFVLSGWGYLIVQIRRVADPDFGLRAAWGAAGYLGVAGVLLAIGICSGPVILGLIGLGAAGFAWRELVTPTPGWRRIRVALRYVREHPGIGVVAIALVALALIQMIGAVAALDRNPWDDDLAYTPFIQRLLDTGDLIEPFSFRRLGAYGGQTVLGALGGARGTLANVHLVDKALFFGLSLLILAGKARERRAQPVWVVTIMLVLLLLPDTAINTASEWTGVAMFLALYRSVARDHWSIVGLVGAAACTLRQNYVAIVVLFVGLVLLHRLVHTRRVTSWREAWAIERPRWRLIAIVATLAIAGWWIAAFVSSRTFLFPYLLGTWNHDVALMPEALTWTQKLGNFLWACIETAPLVIVPVLAVLLAFTDDDRSGRPIRSFFVACVLGFVLLVTGFGSADPFHLWRYAFGFTLALASVFVIEVGAEHERAARLAPLGRWLLLAALVLQLIEVRGQLPKRFAGLFADLREAAAIDRRGDPSARVERQRHAAMQSAVPAGERLAVMLDDPAFLDFSRNRIANLDTPGFASPFADGSQLPAFRGPEPVRAYLVAAGYRYLAFVRSDRSRYFFRREFWLWRLFNDSELFQIMSAYALDTIESFAELATATEVVYDADGLVVLDLAKPTRPLATRDAIASPGSAGARSDAQRRGESIDDEARRRDAWFRAVSEREGILDAWSLTTRGDLRFEDGFAGLLFVEGDPGDPQWYELSQAKPSTSLRGKAMRPMFRRAHLRVRGDQDMRLVLHAAISRNTVYTRPRLDLSLDGELIGTAIADDHGRYAIDLVVAAERLTGGWHDLYLVFNTVAAPDADNRDPRVSRVESVEWVPAP